MKVLIVTHKGIEYEFRLLESVRVIEVTKAGRFSYLMRQDCSGLFHCNCSGAKYHHKCWHEDGDEAAGYDGPDQLWLCPSDTEPCAEWAEEAGRMMYS